MSTKQERDAQLARAHGRVEVEQWMNDHKEDFKPCNPNSERMGNWIKQNRRGELSYENLEAAFQAVNDQLEPVVPVDEFASVPLPASMPNIKSKADINNVPPEKFRLYMTKHKDKDLWKARVEFILRRSVKEN